MTELLSLDLVSKNLVTNQIVLEVKYDKENLINEEISKKYNGEITTDWYGRKVPKHSHGTINLDHKTSSTKLMMKAIMELYNKVVDNKLLARKVRIIANNVIGEDVIQENNFEQVDLFTNYKQKEINKRKEMSEKEIQKAMIDIKKKYGKNAVLKGLNFEKGATTIERNTQVGGHRG